MTAVGMAAVGLGLVLIWAAVKDEDVRDVFARTFRPSGLPPAIPGTRRPSSTPAPTPGLQTA